MRRMKRTFFSTVVLASLVGACGATPRVPLASIDAVDRARSSPAAKEAEKVAPQAMALADADRRKADDSLKGGDEVTADLYASRALVSIEQAIVLSRLARAADSEREARARAEKAASEARELTATRTKIDAENNELDKKLKVARELAQPTPSGPADPKREAARKIAADSLLAQARLLCGAARLISRENGAELDEAEKALQAKSGAAPSSGAQAIDSAAHARAACLSALTRIRRANPEAARGVHADALLAELSATNHFDAARDERGVVVTLRDGFASDSASLTEDAAARLAELGRVLRANPSYRAQVVVHEAAKRDDGTARAKAAATALAQAAGIADGQIATHDAGMQLPVVDPGDTKLRGRNARLEVVFVSPVN